METVPLAEQGILRHPYTIYGASEEGQELRVYLPPEGVVAEYLLVGAIHGDEGETRHLLSHALRAVPVGGLRAAVVLEANPDGCRNNTRCNANGVDLNRNFPTADWEPGDTFYKIRQGEPRERRLSRGAKPGSEAETRALAGLVTYLKPRAVISYHAPLNIIDVAEPSALADWLGRQTNTPVGDLGVFPGSMGSWAKEQGLHLVTYELGHETPDGVLERHLEAAVQVMLAQTGLEDALEPFAPKAPVAADFCLRQGKGR
jgi:protein MpaA